MSTGVPHVAHRRTNAAGGEKDEGAEGITGGIAEIGSSALSLTSGLETLPGLAVLFGFVEFPVLVDLTVVVFSSGLVALTAGVFSLPLVGLDKLTVCFAFFVFPVSAGIAGWETSWETISCWGETSGSSTPSGNG